MFLHSIQTGFRSEGVRMDMRPYLQDSTVVDEEAFREAEYSCKSWGWTTTKDEPIESLGGELHLFKHDGSRALQHPCTETPEVQSSGRRCQGVKTQVATLVYALQTKSNIPTNQQRTPRPRGTTQKWGFQRCQEQNVGDQYRHCFRCGSADHFIRQYYRRYIQDFSRVAKPLYDLLTISPENWDKSKQRTSQKSKAKSTKRGAGQVPSKQLITWTNEHQHILNSILDRLMKPPVMAFPDFSLPFIFHTDASNDGLGAILYQRQQGKLRAISYGSRTLTPAREKLQLALRQVRIPSNEVGHNYVRSSVTNYIMQSHSQFTLITTHWPTFSPQPDYSPM